ncbi:hypothetical protein DA319_09685, partial [Neisseria gonorrhoeae]
KPAFLKFYSSYFLFGQTPRPSGIRPSGRQDQALSGRGASPSESGRRLMCRPVCWNIFYPLNLASRDTGGGRRAANGGIGQTARSRARRIAGWKTPLAGCNV